MKKIFILLFALWWLTPAWTQNGEPEGIALVMANGHYTAVGDVLRNAVGDGEAVAEQLNRKGFRTVLASDLTYEQMLSTIVDFARQARHYTTVVIYYTGHGVIGQAADGYDNFMVPVDANLADKGGVVKKCVSLSLLCDLLRPEEEDFGRRMLFFDACRSMVSLNESSGMTCKDYNGFWTLFASSSGEAADDGNASHSPFTHAWLDAMQEREISNGRLAARIAADVRSRTDGQQSTSLIDHGGFVYTFRNADMRHGVPTLTIISPHGKYKSEIESLQARARKGDTSAIVALGKAYLNGRGICPDKEKAIALFSQAEARGNAEASYLLGRCYAEDYAHPEDLKKAVNHYLKAAEKDYIPAMRPLARLYSAYGGGNGSKWFRRAAELGEAEAQYKMGENIRDWKTPARGREKYEWYTKAAKQGYPPAINGIGFCYDNGIAVEKNQAKAFEYYQRAANAGDKTATYNMVICYANGNGVKKDELKAMYWAERGIQIGETRCKTQKESLLNRKKKQYEASLGSTTDNTKATITTTYQGAALVIANGGYAEPSAMLSTPIKDGAAVADRLTQLGFKVTRAFNLTGVELLATLDQFNTENSGNRAVVVYYTGHAVQARKGRRVENYIVPVEAIIHNNSDILKQCISVDDLNKHLKDCRHKVFFFDACRRLPSLQQPGRGLVQRGNGMNPKSYDDVWALFAVGEPTVEQEQTASSPFAAAWLTFSQRKDLTLGDMASAMGENITAATKGAQHVALGSTATFSMALNRSGKQTLPKKQKMPETAPATGTVQATVPFKPVAKEDDALAFLVKYGYKTPSDDSKQTYNQIQQWYTIGCQEAENGNTAAAKTHLQKAAAKGHTAAMYELAKIHYNEGHYSTSITLSKDAIRLGYQNAYNLLGVCYLNGNGVNINDTLAWDFFRTASPYEPMAMAYMGIMEFYQRNPWHPQYCDMNEVTRLMERAANEGYTDALIILGGFHEQKGDDFKAAECYNTARQRGNKTGAEKYEKMKRKHPTWFN